MKNERKILKHISQFRQRKPSESQAASEICAALNIDLDINIVVFRHLENQGFIIPVNSSVPNVERDMIGITTEGIKHLEMWLPQKIRFYVPIIISLCALQISIISLLRIGD